MTKIIQPMLLCGFVATLFLAASAGAQTTNSEALRLFQKFVNGEVPVKEAIVYRKITWTNQNKINQEWWRFGYQENGRTWFVQRLVPGETNNFVPAPPDGGICGASYSNYWCMSEDNIHLVDKTNYAGSIPDRYGSFPRSLMYASLSLGIPRLREIMELDDSYVEWHGPEFRTLVGVKSNEKNGAAGITNMESSIILNSSGHPILIQMPSAGGMPPGSVTYEYAEKTANLLPSAFSWIIDGTTYRYEFLSLVLGTNDLAQTGGFAPPLFGDVSRVKFVTVWTNSLSWTVRNGKLDPDFIVEKPKRTGAFVLTVILVVTGTFLALLYQRQNKNKTKDKK